MRHRKAVIGQRKTEFVQLTTDTGQRRLTLDYGKVTMKNLKWTMDNQKQTREMANRH